MNDRQVGVVTWFDKNKGYGFIRRHSGDDVVFHCNSIAGWSSIRYKQPESRATVLNSNSFAIVAAGVIFGKSSTHIELAWLSIYSATRYALLVFRVRAVSRTDSLP